MFAPCRISPIPFDNVNALLHIEFCIFGNNIRCRSIFTDNKIMMIYIFFDILLPDHDQCVNSFAVLLVKNLLYVRLFLLCLRQYILLYAAAGK
jgi:hypothetical protein